jgi:acetyl esterase/lipase
MLSDSAELLPGTPRDKIVAAFLRGALRIVLKPMLSPRLPLRFQRWWLHLLALTQRSARGVEVERVITGGLAAEWVKPAGDVSDTCILYLHGGGFCAGSPATHRALTTRLARASGLITFVPDYSLVPDFPFPFAIRDAISAYQLLAETGPVVLAGDSAGAFLALAVAVEARDRGMRPPSALLLFSPWLDLANIPDDVPGEVTTSAAFLRSCARHVGATASPLQGNLAGLPPTLIQAGADELLLRDAMRLYAAMHDAGGTVRCEIVPQRWHAFQIHAGMLPSADAALKRAAEFIATNSVHSREGGNPVLS